MAVQKEMEMLRDAPVLAGVSDEYLQLLSFSAEPFDVQNGNPILVKGQTQKSAILLVKGQATIHAGNDILSPVLQKIQSGTIIAELAMIIDVQNEVSIYANTAVSAKRISQELLLKVASEFPDFANQLRAGSIQKLEKSISELTALQKTLQTFTSRN